MKQNVGSPDRTVRLSLGTLLLLVGVVGYVGLVPLAWVGIGQALASVVAALLGVVFLVTGATRTCLVYRLVGFSTAESTPETDEPAAEPPA